MIGLSIPMLTPTFGFGSFALLFTIFICILMSIGCSTKFSLSLRLYFFRVFSYFSTYRDTLNLEIVISLKMFSESLWFFGA